jgi:hypothetical protein
MINFISLFIFRVFVIPDDADDDRSIRDDRHQKDEDEDGDLRSDIIGRPSVELREVGEEVALAPPAVIVNGEDVRRIPRVVHGGVHLVENHTISHIWKKIAVIRADGWDIWRIIANTFQFLPIKLNRLVYK